MSDLRDLTAIWTGDDRSLRCFDLPDYSPSEHIAFRLSIPNHEHPRGGRFAGPGVAFAGHLSSDIVVLSTVADGHFCCARREDHLE